MAEDTIPRPIRYKFLAVAQEVCELAKVDYWEQSEVLSSLREQMEISYRAYEQAGRFEDDPETKALEDFGPAEDVARIHRAGMRGLWQRLLFNQRYSVHRLVAPVLFCMLHIFLKTTGSLSVTILASGNLRWRVALYGWDFYVGVIIIALIGMTRLATRYLRIPRQFAESVAILLAIWLLSELVSEWMASVTYWSKNWNLHDNVPQWENVLAGMVDLLGYVIEAVAFFFVFAMSAAEILEVPTRHRAIIEAKRKRNLANAGVWALWLDNCFKVLSGQTWNNMVWKTVR